MNNTKINTKRKSDQNPTNRIKAVIEDVEVFRKEKNSKKKYTKQK